MHETGILKRVLKGTGTPLIAKIRTDVAFGSIVFGCAEKWSVCVHRGASRFASIPTWPTSRYGWRPMNGRGQCAAMTPVNSKLGHIRAPIRIQEAEMKYENSNMSQIGGFRSRIANSIESGWGAVAAPDSDSFCQFGA